MRVPKPILFALTLALVSVSGLAAGGCNPQSEKRLWRYVGLGAGAYLGAGIPYVLSERNVPPKVAAGAIVGGVAGYFLGRSIDRGGCPKQGLDPFTRARLRDRFATREALRFATQVKSPAKAAAIPATVQGAASNLQAVSVSAIVGGQSCECTDPSLFF